MKKIIDAKTLDAIADDILHNCFMLGFTDEESAEDDIGFYIPRIKGLAESLKSIAQQSPPAPADQGGMDDGRQEGCR